MADNQQKSTKKLALITYVIAVVCLLAGLFLPWGPVKTEGYNPLAFQLPQALGAVGIKLGDIGTSLIYSYPVAIWGIGEGFDLGAALVLLYGIACVIALIMLIPVIKGGEETNTSAKCAGIVEVISTVILTVLLCMEMAWISTAGYELYSWSIALLVAFGGSFIMLIIQSVAVKGASGVIKSILAVLSCAAIVFCLFSFTTILPGLAEAFKDLLSGNNQILALTAEGKPYLGSIWYHLAIPFSQNYGDFLKELGGLNATLSVFMLLLGVLLIVNFVLDVCGLIKKTTRKMIIANLIRYGLELVFALVVLIVGKLIAGYDVGMLCYALIILAILPVLLNIFRLIAYKDDAKVKLVQNRAAYETAATQAPAYQAQPQYAPAPQAVQPAAQPQYPPAPQRQPQYAPAPQAVQPQQPAPATPAEQPAPAPQRQPQYPPAPSVAKNDKDKVYSPVIYSGPRDAFIDTLSNEERIEFAKTFIERKNGDIQGVPEYKLDGNNDKFFQSLFIYYSRVRGLVSDGLMNKFYEKVNAIKKA